MPYEHYFMAAADGCLRNRDSGFAPSGSQGLRAKQAQLELESDMQGRDKVLGEENIGHNLLKKMGAFLVH